MNLRRFPPIMSKKLQTLSISNCPKLDKVSQVKQIHQDRIGREAASYKQSFTNLRKWFSCGLEEPSLSRNIKEPSLSRNINHIGFPLIHGGLTKLNLSYCRLGDDDIGSVVGELSTLQELNVSGNYFRQIGFILLRLPRLKCLNVSYCRNLVELLELPSSIAILKADSCRSLESIGDISNCKWLWKVSLVQDSGCRSVGDEILDSIFQGNATEDQFFSLAFPAYDVQVQYEDNSVRRERFTWQFPLNNLYDESCGFLICIDSWKSDPVFTIILRPEMVKDFRSDFCKPAGHHTYTYTGYLSFNWLKRHTRVPWWNSAYNMISLSVTDGNKGKDISFEAALLPKESKGDPVQTTKMATYYSEFWDKEHENKKTFTIQQDSNFYINIQWRPRL